MPLPSSIDDLSQTKDDNFPSGSESPVTADNYLRFHAACIALLRDQVGDLEEGITFPNGLTVPAKALTTPVAVAFSATPTINAALSNVFYMSAVVSTNITSLTINNPVDGQTISIRFVQDGTGGRSIAVPAGAKVSGAVETGAGRVSELQLKYVGTASGVAVNRWEGSWFVLPA